MKIFGYCSQLGISRVVKMVVIGAITLGAVGSIILWVVVQRPVATDSAPTDARLEQALANAKCEYQDKELCKFFTAWGMLGTYKMTSTTTSGGKTTTIVYETSHDGKRTHVLTTIKGKPYEVVVIDGVTYTKAANGTWWKQTTASVQPDTSSNLPTIDLIEPGSKTSGLAYRFLGKHACGDRQCFEYEVTDKSNSRSTQALWFDDKDYRPRRLLIKSHDKKTDIAYEYTGVNIVEPSPVKELGPNQYLLPGQDEPMTVPTLDSQLPG